MIVPPSDRINGKKVSFMATCLCDAIYSDAAKSAVILLKKFGCEVSFPKDQTCCGQPAFNTGDFSNAIKTVEHTMDVFKGNDNPIILPSASCAAMLYHSTKILFPNNEEVEKFSKRVWELCDFLVNSLGVEKTGGKLNAKIAIHNSCHSKGSGTPDAMIKLLQSIDGVEIVEFEGEQSCCGFGGTFSVVFPEISSELGKLKVKNISKVNPDYIVAADTSCLLHQKGIADKSDIPYNAHHIAEILVLAMKNGGLL